MSRDIFSKFKISCQSEELTGCNVVNTTTYKREGEIVTRAHTCYDLELLPVRMVNHGLRTRRKPRCMYPAVSLYILRYADRQSPAS